MPGMKNSDWFEPTAKSFVCFTPRLKRQISWLAAALVLFPARGLAADSSMFRGNPEHTGVYGGPAVSQFHRVKWTFPTSGKIISSPGIADGNVYFGSTDGNLYAIDLETGRQKWKFKTQARITSSPAITQGLVYFGSYDGKFYAVDASTGARKWEFKTQGERRFAARHIHGILPEAETMPDPFDFYLSSPVVWNGAVYFGSGDGNVYALDAVSGELKWKFATGDVVHASPALAGGTLFIGSWDSYFYAIDASTGKEKWRFKTGEDHEIFNQVGIQSSAAVMDGTVYFGCRDSNLYAVEAATGQKKWAFNNKGSWVIGSPAVRDGKVYFSTSDSAQLYRLDAKSGTQDFVLDMKWLMFSSPALVDKTLYIGTHEGKLFAVDVTAHKVLWDFQTESSRKNAPSMTNANGKPDYAAVFKENFYDNLVTSMDKLLSVGAILSSPVVVDGVIYFGSTDGNLYAIE
jgi:outer membrane protein assembly factor BamB